jgi:AraC-like DNA-binding protein
LDPTLVSSDMHYWRLNPDARLRSRVLCYFAALPAPDGSARNRPFDEALLLPDGYSELVFNLAAPYERWPIGENVRRSVMQAGYVIGGRSHSVLTRNMGEVKVVGVKLDSRFLRQLVGVPLAEFRDSTVTMAELNQRSLLNLEDEIGNAHSIAEISAIFDRFLLRMLGKVGPTDAMVDHLLHRIGRERGTLSIMQWATEQRIDSSNLERRFCAWTGMAPKRYARIVRFKHSYHRLLSTQSHGGGNKSAHLDGYYDQSHFDRDFKYFIGVAPAIRLRGALRQETGVSDHLLEGEFARSACS